MAIRLFLFGIPLLALATGIVINGRSQAQNTTLTSGNPALDNPVEVGHVRWGRDLDAALQKSAETGKPVFVLFQEVPGCSGCQDFGKTVLTEPLLVEAIEDEFIPVLVYNNRSGPDQELLKRYAEPSWNYQVMRFLNAEGKDLIPRRDGVWTTPGVRSRMIQALQAAGRRVPMYLHTVAAEREPGLETSAYAMFCFWVGEVDLGLLDGVVSTEAGWFDGHEVTRVLYNPQQISLKTLSQNAHAARCAARKVYTATPSKSPFISNLPVGQLTTDYRAARASDQNRQMIGYESVLNLQSLTEMQTTKVNAYIRSNPQKALAWLSPRQRETLAKNRTSK